MSVIADFYFWIDEPLSMVIGIVVVVCLIYEKIWAWPLGVLFCFLSLLPLYEARLFGYVTLTVVGFLPLNIYGWYYWIYGGDDKLDLPVTHASWAMLGVLGGLCALGVFGLPYVFEFVFPSYEEAAMPILDNSIMALSMAAMWLTSRKKLENWVLWFTINVMTVALYFLQDLFWLMALYGVYIVLAVHGFMTWRRSMRRGSETVTNAAS